MCRWMIALALLPLLSLAAPAAAAAQPPTAEPAPPAVYIIFDGSGSMWGQLPDGTHKVTAAREVLDEFVAQDFAGRQLALRAYGHRRKGDCQDSELVVDFAAAEAAAGEIRSFAEAVNPKGKTPIGRSLRAALADMGDRPGEIILISDGIETCDDDPCALVAAWRDKDVAIRVHVVGLGLNEKEKAAMQCIADAAGTDFQDAQSAEQLAQGLESIRETAASSPPPQSTWQVLALVGETAAGEKIRTHGVARREGEEAIELSSNGYNRVPPGTWTITAGVRTRNGQLYRPQTRTVEVSDSGATEARFTVEEPPSVKARFAAAGEAHNGSLITAYQDGERAFRLRPGDRAYVDPGTYEFRATVNQDNELSLEESFQHGDHKELVFEMVRTVRVSLKVVAAGSGIPFRGNFELWQDGEKRYSVHRNNGAQVLPGTYDVKLLRYLTPYVHPGLEVTSAAVQEYEIEVPVGHLTVHYEGADGQRLDANRYFLERVIAGTYKSDHIQTSGRRIPLTAGSYKLEGWSRLGDFDPIVFEIETGEEKEIVLRPKG